MKIGKHHYFHLSRRNFIKCAASGAASRARRRSSPG